MPASTLSPRFASSAPRPGPGTGEPPPVIGEPPVVIGEPPVAAPLVLDSPPARASLRAQIARLERRLAALAADLGAPGRSLPLPGTGDSAADPRPARRVARRGPRLLGLDELERARDRLVCRVRSAEALLSQRSEREESAARRLAAMLAAPERHRFERVLRADLGLPGCGAYEVRPRLGLVGMLAGWWEVKLSSGCPLPGARDAAAHLSPWGYGYAPLAGVSATGERKGGPRGRGRGRGGGAHDPDHLRLLAAGPGGLRVLGARAHRSPPQPAGAARHAGGRPPARAAPRGGRPAQAVCPGYGRVPIHPGGAVRPGPRPGRGRRRPARGLDPRGHPGIGVRPLPRLPDLRPADARRPGSHRGVRRVRGPGFRPEHRPARRRGLARTTPPASFCKACADGRR